MPQTNHERVGKGLVDLLYGYTEASMFGFAGSDDLVLDFAGDVDGDGKRHTLVATAAAVDLRIDADHLTACVEQRATRVAGVHSYVGLDKRHGAVVG